MKAFTLIEIAIIILIVAILTGISLRFTAFSPDILYLKNFVYKLGSNVNLLKDFSLGRRLIDPSLKVCGYGIIFFPTTTGYEYFGYVSATSSVLDCDFIALNDPLSYAPSSPFYYLHTNGEIRQDPIEVLQIKDKFLKGLGGEFRLSLSSPTCSDNLFLSYSRIALVYYNPYGDLLLLGRNSSWENLLPLNWNNIYFCLKYKKLYYLSLKLSLG